MFVSKDFFKTNNDNINFVGDAFFAFPPSFAQGASQSIEGAYDKRSKLNQFAFHLSNPVAVFFRNIFLKKFIKNKKFLDSYLGKSIGTICPLRL